jgi:hypothetical protein
MFSMHDRIRSSLLGLANVYVHALGNQEGFFYRLPDQSGVLFATLTELEAPAKEIHYRFHPQASALTRRSKSWQVVRGWPGWVQAVNPCCEEEEAVWLGILASYRHALEAKQVTVTKVETTVRLAPIQARTQSGGQRAVL